MSAHAQALSILTLISCLSAIPGVAHDAGLYPIAVPLAALEHAVPGDWIPLLEASGPSGHFGWLSWSGDRSARRLAESLQPPGNARGYLNPDRPDDHEVSPGDWVHGCPGLTWNRGVRDGLVALIGREGILPVWSECRGTGANAAYRVCGFVRIGGVRLDWGKAPRLWARFLGWWPECRRNEPPSVDAGPDRAVNLTDAVHLSAQVTDDGRLPGIGLELAWTCVSGPGEVRFSAAHALETEAAFTTNGVYQLRLSAGDTLGTGADDVIVTVNGPPTVAAGPDIPVTLEDPLCLRGTVTDDGLLPGGPLVWKWSVVSGPGVVSLEDPWALSPVVAFTAAGVYRIRLTATDGQLTGWDEIEVTVRAVNHPPVVHAGSDQIVRFPEPVRLEGLVTDDGEPAGGLMQTRWELGSGPGTVTISEPAALLTSCAFDQPGRYQLRLIADDGERRATNHVQVIANQPPSVGAGPDQRAILGLPVTLEGAASDDGWPLGRLVVAWTQVTGPAPVLFESATADIARARFSQAGSYVLRLTASDGHAATSDDVAVVVCQAGSNLPPAVTAGPDQRLALTHSVRLQGRVLDDGFPGSDPLIIEWAQVSGPAPVSFEDSTDPATTAWFSTGGVYVLRLTAAEGSVRISADVRLEVYPDNQPPSVEAGPDQIVVRGPAMLFGRVLDDGRPSGRWMRCHWSVEAGPAPVEFTPPERIETRVRFEAPGTYRLRLTADDGEWSAFDEMVVTVTGNQPPRVNAGDDQWLERAEPGTASASSSVSRVIAPDAWQTACGQPGLMGLWGNVGEVVVPRHGLAWSGIDLVVGGSFQYAAGLEVRHLARWTGCGFEPLFDPSPVDPANPASAPLGFVTDSTAVNPVAAVGREVFVGGGFLKDLDHDGHKDFTARWDGAHWVPWHFAIASAYVAHGTMLAVSNEVFVAGQFKFQPSKAAADQVGFNLACWRDGNWSSLGEGIRDIADDTRWESPQHGIVKALAMASDGTLYAGGRFVTATPSGLATNLAHWTGTEWEPVGGGVGGCTGYGCASEVLALAAAPDGSLWVGGNFTRAGALPVQHVARWDGADWSAAGPGFNAPVQALALRGSTLFAGGDFSSTPGGVTSLPSLARWDGATWTRVGGVGANGGVLALVDTPDGLAVGGRFSRIGTDPANHLAFWGHVPPPQLAGPPPLSATVEPAGVAELTLALEAWQPCGRAFEVNWFVDGGTARQTDAVSSASPERPAELTFSHAYEPGTHDLSAVADDGLGNRVTYRTSVSVLAPTPATLLGTVADDGFPDPASLHARWRQVEGPKGAQLLTPDDPTGVVRLYQTGTYVFRLEADDGEFEAADEVTLHVHPAGVASTAPSVVVGGEAWISLDDTALLEAWVEGGSPGAGARHLGWECLAGPGEVVFATETGPCTNRVEGLAATAGFAVPGDYLFQFTIHDGPWLIRAPRVIHVDPTTNEPPVVEAGPDITCAVGQAIALRAQVADDGRPYGLLDHSWSVVEAPGGVALEVVDETTWACFGAPGQYRLRCTANDGRVESSDDLGLTVLESTPPPEVVLEATLDESVVTAPHAVSGRVTGASLVSWELQTRMVGPARVPDEGNAPWETIASGQTEMRDAPLGILDPTLKLNGLHEIRLRAEDRLGRTSSTEPVTVVVEGGMKVGHVELAFTDLTVPVAGEPLRVVRTYDSRDVRMGAFGRGWQLALGNWRLQKSAPLGRDWQAVSSGGLFPVYELKPGRSRYVALTFPNGRVARFRFAPQPLAQPLVPILYPRWNFMPFAGTHGSLEPLGEELDENGSLVTLGRWPVDAGVTPVDLFDFSFVAGNTWQGTTAELYARPTRFRYRSPEGFAFEMDEAEGLQRMTDPCGNTLTISSNGLTWSHPEGSDTVAVRFERDPAGRIVRIQDPAGQSMDYDYDSAGRLVGFVDRARQRTTFTYHESHRLASVVAPTGVAVVRYDYDAEGRRIAETDPTGARTQFRHDLARRTETIEDALGQVTVHEYDPRGNVVRTLAADGGVTSAIYDDRDRLRVQVDPLGRTRSCEYDAAGNMGAYTGPDGATCRFSYSSRNQVETVTDGAGATTRYTYEDRGQLIEITDPLGRRISLGYDRRGLPVASTNALGQVTRFAHDRYGRLSSEIDPLGHAIYYDRDPLGAVVAVRAPHTDEQGRVRELKLELRRDPLGRVTEVIRPDGSALVFELDEAGKPVKATDRLGRITRWNYDVLGRLRQRIDPDGAGEGWSRDALGQLVGFTNRLGAVTHYGRDPMGRLSALCLPDGTRQAWTFDQAGQLQAQIDALGRTTTYGYDPGGRLAAITNRLGEIHHFTHDPAGNLQTVTDPLGHTFTWRHDALGNLVEFTEPDGRARRWAYDAANRLITETDAVGATVGRAYDPSGRLVGITNAQGEATRYEYDDLGRLAGVVDANAHRTRLAFDDLGRWIRRTLPGGGVESLERDPVGRASRYRDANGDTTTFEYDLLDRLREKRPDPRRGEPSVTFAYDLLGQRTAASNLAGNGRWHYDAQGRLVRKDWTWAATGQTASLAYDYDANGNVATVRSSTPGGTELAYAYDALDRLVVVESRQLGLTGYTYDAAGNLEGCFYPNGVAAHYRYDTSRRLTHVAWLRLDTPVAEFASAIGADGRRRVSLDVIAVDGGTWSGNRTFDYDAAGRLIAESFDGPGAATRGLVEYRYDAVGNRLARASTLPWPDSQQWGYDDDDRPIADRFDANGNTLRAQGVLQARDDAYDFENRLLSRHTPDQEVGLDYDPDGHRVARFLRRPDGLDFTGFLVDDLSPAGQPQILEELRLDANTPEPPRLLAAFTFGHQWIAQHRPGEAGTGGHFALHDLHRNVRALTDPQATVSDVYTYDAFGLRLERFGHTPNPRQFAGEWFDEALGMVDLRARWLDPNRGRFWTRDAFPGFAEDPATLHGYAYAGNDPVNGLDPSGHLTVREVAYASSVGAMFQGCLGAFSRAAGAASGGAGLDDTLEASVDGLETDVAEGAIGGVFGLGVSRGTAWAVGRLGPKLLRWTPTGLVAWFDRTAGSARHAWAQTEAAWARIEREMLGGDSRVSQIALPNASAEPSLSALRPGSQGLDLAGVASGAETLPSKLYHYTGAGNAESILQNGLGAGGRGTFATPAGNLSPVQAQIELALPANRGYPGALFEIDTARLQQLQINPAVGPRRIMSTPNAGGGGVEYIFNQPIPPSAIRQVPFP